MQLFPRSLCILQQSLERSLAAPIWKLRFQQSQPAVAANMAQAGAVRRRIRGKQPPDVAVCILGAIGPCVCILVAIGPCYWIRVLR